MYAKEGATKADMEVKLELSSRLAALEASMERGFRTMTFRLIGAIFAMQALMLAGSSSRTGLTPEPGLRLEGGIHPGRLGRQHEVGELRTETPIFGLGDGRNGAAPVRHRSYVDAPLVGKHDVERRVACGSGTVVCPASRCGAFRPRACMVFVRSDPVRLSELQGSSCGAGFSDPVSLTVCTLFVVLPALG